MWFEDLSWWWNIGLKKSIEQCDILDIVAFIDMYFTFGKDYLKNDFPNVHCSHRIQGFKWEQNCKAYFYKKHLKTNIR